MIDRKCLKCQTWNNEELFCKSCGAVLAPEEISRIEEEKYAAELDLRPKPKLDIILDSAKNSKYLVVRILFYTLYSVAVIVFAIGSFIAYLVAWSPG